MNKHDKNLNNTYYESLDENFNHAIELFEKDLTQEELIKLLKTGNILQKQIAALKITTINNNEEAEVLCSNLTGNDGKIREATSLKLLELSKTHFEYFKTENIYQIFLDAIIDVNPNICRNMLEIIKPLKSEKNFIEFFIPKLLNKTNTLISEVEKFDFQDGKYKINKEVFKLYWYLETIYELTDYIKLDDLTSILKRTKDINEYTIREKTAKILTKNFDDETCKEIKEILKQDKNYYVRRF